MNLRAVLLGFLTRGDLTGYELKGAMDESVGFFFGARYGSIYPTLRSLEEEGFVRSTLVVQSDRPNKKVYSLTPEGRALGTGAAAPEVPTSGAPRSLVAWEPCRSAAGPTVNGAPRTVPVILVPLNPPTPPRVPSGRTKRQSS